MTLITSKTLTEWQAEAREAGHKDTYAYVAERCGITRDQVKNLFFARMYGTTEQRLSIFRSYK